MIPIKTALCSFGMSGKTFHAPFLHVNPGFEFYSVWEREKNLAATLYPSVRVCRTLEELLADPAVELVVVNTPNYTHFEYAKQALQAGKHVVIDKPFAVTAAEAKILLETALEMNGITVINIGDKFAKVVAEASAPATRSETATSSGKVLLSNFCSISKRWSSKCNSPAE